MFLVCYALVKLESKLSIHRILQWKSLRDVPFISVFLHGVFEFYIITDHPKK